MLRRDAMLAAKEFLYSHAASTAHLGEEPSPLDKEALRVLTEEYELTTPELEEVTDLIKDECRFSPQEMNMIRMKSLIDAVAPFRYFDILGLNSITRYLEIGKQMEQPNDEQKFFLETLQRLQGLVEAAQQAHALLKDSLDDYLEFAAEHEATALKFMRRRRQGQSPDQ